MRHSPIATERRSLQRLGMALGLTGITLLGIWLVVLYSERRSTELVGLATARALADEIAIVRAVYSSHVLPQARAHGCPVDVDAKENSGIPLPVTIIKHVGDEHRRRGQLSEVAIFSDFPFERQRSLTAFQVQALAHLQEAPDRPFYQIVKTAHGPIIHYAVAERMVEECVSCHNAHPSSPKRDWKVGDFRGAVEVAVPLKESVEMIHERDRSIVGLLASGLLVLGFTGTLFWRYDVNRQARELWALTDELTGAIVRRRGMELIEVEVARAKRRNEPLAFALFDLDEFKRINDTLGHQVGDQVLAAVGQILRSSVRPHDQVIRWGGEEFLVVLPHTELRQAHECAERIRVEVGRLVRPTAITVSCGLATLPDDREAVDAIAEADKMLYEAKRTGRNKVLPACILS